MGGLFKSMLFWLLLTSSLAFFWPADVVGFDPFWSTKWMLWGAVAATMFSLGALVSPEELKPLKTKPWWVVLGVIVQVTVMPLAAWMVTRVVPMDQETALGVLLVGCVPGAMASNVLTNTAGGSVAYSVSMTSVATFFSPITVPSILWVVARQETQGSLAKSSMLLAALVTLPTLLGYFTASHLKAVTSFFHSLGSFIASVALLWIISTVVASNRDSLMAVGWLIVIALLLVNLTGYLGGYLVGGVVALPKGYRRALTLEIGMQNAGLGTTLSVSILGGGTAAAIPTAVYTFGCMLTGTMLAVMWKRIDRISSDLRDDAGASV